MLNSTTTQALSLLVVLAIAGWLLARSRRRDDSSASQADPKALMAALRRPAGGIREAHALAKAGPASLPVLLEAVEDPEPRLRGLTCFALGELKPPSPEVFRALRSRLDDEDHEVRASAVMALGSQKTVPAALREQLETMHRRDPDPAVRDSAAEALLKITGTPPASPLTLDALLRELTASERLQREEALNELGRQGLAKHEGITDEKVLRALTERLVMDEYFQARVSAALALWRVGKAPAFVIEALTTALGDQDRLVRTMTVQVLGNFGPQAAAAISKLEVLAADTTDPDGARLARAAIERIAKP